MRLWRAGMSETCRAAGCGREIYHLGPCVKNPKPGVAYTDGLGSLGCGSWPRDAYGNVVRPSLLPDERSDVDPGTSEHDGFDPLR